MAVLASGSSVAESQSSSDFLSVTSNFTAQHAELTEELAAQAELLKSPDE